ncbi:MAG: universal stress protein [Propionivibrio sp.]|nr:universal stress protein [Propionivibrio sp.]
MKRFKNILFVHSERVGSDDALERATELAKGNAARLTIADVVSDSDASPIVLTERQKRLTRLAASVRLAGVDATVVVDSGTPSLVLTRQVLREGHDLVIMAADSEDSFSHFFFGSTSMHLMRECPCPVWVLQTHRPRPYRKILAAVDWQTTASEKDELNVKIMDFATSLARTEASELHIVHAWEFTGNDSVTIKSEINDEIRDRLFHKHQSMHMKRIEDLLAHYDLKELQYLVHVVNGPAESTISEIVKKQDIDLIVMGTACRTGISGFFIGNTAELVLSQVPCSVLVVKPEGFVTPIELSP